MTEEERAKHSAPIEASTPTGDSPDDDNGVETPMWTVWLSLGAIVAAGLYGLYLGSSAKSKSKDGAAATSALNMPTATQLASNDWARGRRPS
jgi:hypothetical protein